MSQDEDDALLDLDLAAFDPQATQRILAAIDKSEDPHLAIDIVRRAVWKMAVRMQLMGKLIRTQQNAINELQGKKPLTDTGVWRVVKAKQSEEEMGLVKKIMWAAVCGIGTALLGGLVWVGQMAWKGFHSP